jgi:hypothetical protein
MAAFVQYGLTLAGRNLIAKGAAGKTISYTRIAVGDGQLTQAQDPSTMTALVHEVLSIDITSVEMIGDGQVRVRGAFSNGQLQTGFLYREIGLFATDPDTGLEVLYCYGNAVDQAEWIPPAGTSTAIERIVNVITTVGPATNVTAVLKSGVYITTEDFDAAMALKADQAWTEAQLSNKVNAMVNQVIEFTTFTNGIMKYGTYFSGYLRDQFGRVDLWLTFRKETGFFSGRTVVGILPEGFRPMSDLHSVGCMWSGQDNIMAVVDQYLSPYGEVVFYFPDSSNYDRASFYFPFQTAK